MKQRYTYNYAEVSFERGSSSVRVTIDGCWFNSKDWTELTKILFPTQPQYEIALDEWLP